MENLPKAKWIIAIIIATVFVSQAAVTSNSIRDCQVTHAVPIEIKYMDYFQENYINAKIRVNEPYGIYTSLNGFIKMETIWRSDNCGINRIHHARCNLTTELPHVDTLEITIWNNCTWNYVGKINMQVERPIVNNVLRIRHWKN